MKLSRRQVWELRASVDGGHRLHSAMDTKELQEAEMTRLVQELPDALLVYRDYRHDGTYHQESHLDRTLATLPKPWRTR